MCFCSWISLIFVVWFFLCLFSLNFLFAFCKNNIYFCVTKKIFITVNTSLSRCNARGGSPRRQLWIIFQWVSQIRMKIDENLRKVKLQKPNFQFYFPFNCFLLFFVEYWCLSQVSTTINNNLSRNIIIKYFTLIFKTFFFSNNLSSNNSILFSLFILNLHLRVLFLLIFIFLHDGHFHKKKGLYQGGVIEHFQIMTEC